MFDVIKRVLDRIINIFSYDSNVVEYNDMIKEDENYKPLWSYTPININKENIIDIDSMDDDTKKLFYDGYYSVTGYDPYEWGNYEKNNYFWYTYYITVKGNDPYEWGRQYATIMMKGEFNG